MQLNRIKAILESRGISQTWLAKQLDKSFGTINAWCQNKTQPSLENLHAIASILSINLKDLIEDEQNNNQIISTNDK